jgi:CheY-like chemotaxis protein
MMGLIKSKVRILGGGLILLWQSDLYEAKSKKIIGDSELINPLTSYSKRTLTSSTSRKIRIMAVDDEEDILQVIKRSLELHDFVVDTYVNPKQALSEYRPNVYDLVILDIRMPGMDGFELYRKIRELDTKVKVCFLTAFETYRERFRESFPELEEVKCYIKKPISATELIRHIEKVLELH